MDQRLQLFGFAKLVGQDASYIIRKYDFQLGRASKNSTLDVALSPDNMNISRLHAKIVFDFQDRCFKLVVVGKNGVHLNGVHITPPEPNQPQGVPLCSQDLLVLSDRVFCFLLPKHSPLSHVKRSSEAHTSAGTAHDPCEDPASKRIKVEDQQVQQQQAPQQPAQPVQTKVEEQQAQVQAQQPAIKAEDPQAVQQPVQQVQEAHAQQPVTLQQPLQPQAQPQPQYLQPQQPLQQPPPPLQQQ